MSKHLVEKVKEVLAEKKKRNPSYSLRGFAHHLEVSPTLLSQAMNGKLELSSHQMISISEKLEFASEETMEEIFIHEAPHDSKWKKDAEVRLKSRHYHQKNKVNLDRAQFKAFNKSWVAVLCMLIELPEPPKNSAEAAAILGVSAREVSEVLQELLQIGAIEFCDQGYRKTGDFFNLIFDGAEMSHSEYNRSFLEETLKYFESSTPTERVIGTEILSLDESLLEDARKIIYRCLDDLAALSVRSQKKDSVYQVGIQMLPVKAKNVGKKSA